MIHKIDNNYILITGNFTVGKLINIYIIFPQQNDSAKTTVLSHHLTNLTNFTRMAFKNIYTLLTEYLFIVKRYQKVRLPSRMKIPLFSFNFFKNGYATFSIGMKMIVRSYSINIFF